MLQEEGAARSWTKVKDCLLDVIAKKKKEKSLPQEGPSRDIEILFLPL